MQETVKTKKNNKKNIDSSHVSAPENEFIKNEPPDGGASTGQNVR
jgi:hypothetical protein